jgi:hypothetical protein
MYNQGWGRDNVDGSIVIHNLKRGDNITLEYGYWLG